MANGPIAFHIFKEHAGVKDHTEIGIILFPIFVLKRGDGKILYESKPRVISTRPDRDV